MKPFLLLIAACASVAPLSAQNEGPGNDLIELFEKSQREGASDEELMRMLEDKTLLMDLRGLESPEVSPEELQREKEAVFDVMRLLKGQVQAEGLDRAKDDASPRRELESPFPRQPRWLVGIVVQPLDPALRSHFDLPEGAGVIVESVMRGGPAAEAGIKTNDLIVTANERKISSLEDLKAAVEQAGSEGKEVNLEVIQRGKRSVVKVTPRGPEPSTGKAEQEEQSPANRPMIEIQRRLDRQQREIEALRRELRELRDRLQ